MITTIAIIRLRHVHGSGHGVAFFVVGRIFDIPWAHIPWSGFADLLANLIEKYASELDVKNLPAPAVPLEDQDSAAADKKESVFRPEAVRPEAVQAKLLHDIIDVI